MAASWNNNNNNNSSSSNNNNNRFGVACARVRQFMMEQNRQVRMGDLVGSSSFQRPPPLQLMTPVPVATGPAATWDTGATTLSLFPAGTGGTEIIRPEVAQGKASATLTIFYQGQVATFHNFPAHRAMDLIKMAGVASGKEPEKGVTITTAVAENAEAAGDEPSAAGAAMPPIARKLSLQRFLRKRKNRFPGTDDDSEAEHNEGEEAWWSRKKRDSAGPSSSNNNPAEDVPDDATWLRL